MNKQQQLRLYQQMLYIRKVQLAIESRYSQDQMKTPVHLCIGQEAAAVGVCAGLIEGDVVFSNHRGHGHYLARGGDLNAMIDELHCKESGCSKAYGGSMHLVDLKKGLIGSSSIVAGGIPLAVGAGLSFQLKKEPKVAVVFFGDGAVDEGVFYESMNFAGLKKLPVVFVCENNFYSVCSHISQRQPKDCIVSRAKAFSLYADKVDGSNVEKVFVAAKKAIDRARSAKGPSLLECKVYRFRGHAGAGDDLKDQYRCLPEWKHWIKKDPLMIWEKKIRLSSGLRQQMDQELDKKIAAAFESAQESALPKPENLFNNVYS